jgi:hypothetical protein
MEAGGGPLSRHAAGPAATFASLALLLAACSSNSSSSASDTSVVATEATPGPTGTSASTMPTSSSIATTTSSTTSSTSTSTTVDPVKQTETDIRAAVRLAQRTFSRCLVTMPNCDPSTLAVARAGDLLDRNVARIEEWNEAGYTVQNRDEFRFVIEEVSIHPSGRQAAVLVCIADGSDLVQPGAGPGGADVIIDDSYTSGRASWDMRLDADGKWRAYDAPAVGPTESSDVCPGG